MFWGEDDRGGGSPVTVLCYACGLRAGPSLGCWGVFRSQLGCEGEPRCLGNTFPLGTHVDWESDQGGLPGGGTVQVGLEGLPLRFVCTCSPVVITLTRNQSKCFLMGAEVPLSEQRAFLKTQFK